MNRDDANDTIFLYHQKEQEVPDTIKSVPHYTFTSDILHNMGYTPIEQQLLPGSNQTLTMTTIGSLKMTCILMVIGILFSTYSLHILLTLFQHI